jgi:hypothetical protein
MAFHSQIISTTNDTDVAFIGNTATSMMLTNSHATAAVTLDLFIKNILTGANSGYILRNVKIPNGVSLKLEQDEFAFNNRVYKLVINTDNAGGGINIITRS